MIYNTLIKADEGIFIPKFMRVYNVGNHPENNYPRPAVNPSRKQ